MNTELRRKKIYDCIKQNYMYSVTSLSEQFHVSKMTIRRDLDFLESQNLINRVYGKAILKEQDLDSSDFERRTATNANAKKAIAQKALPFLSDINTIYVDSSSTCNYLIDIIPPNYNLTIYTNNIFTLNTIIKKPWLKAFVFGGILSHSSQSIDSTVALKSVKDIYIDAVFISCSGFTSNKIFNNDLISISERRIMLKNSTKRFLLADDSKYNVNGLFTVCTWDMIDTFITNQPLDENMSAALRKNNVTTLI